VTTCGFGGLPLGLSSGRHPSCRPRGQVAGIVWVMAELDEAARVLSEAEDASAAGDHAAAERALRRALKLQEASLGLVHPDVANTLNNLGVVCDILGRSGEAEFLYRRALGIARKTLPADHPYIATSLENLANLYQAQGRSEKMATVAHDRPQRSGLPGTGIEVQVEEEELEAPEPLERFETEAVTPVAVASGPVASSESESAARAGIITAVWSRRPPWLVPVSVGVVVLTLVWLLAGGRDDSETPAPQSADAEMPLETVGVDRELVSGLVPDEVASGAPDREETEDEAPADVAPEPPASPPRSIETRVAPVMTVSEVVADARVCRRLVTRGEDDRPLADWQCDPVVDGTGSGPLFFYTRVRSRTATTIVHRWFRNDRLDQEVSLAIQANDGPGYRTYSTRTVSSQETGSWRVELRSADEQLLHVEELVVR